MRTRLGDLKDEDWKHEGGLTCRRVEGRKLKSAEGKAEGRRSRTKAAG